MRTMPQQNALRKTMELDEVITLKGMQSELETLYYPIEHPAKSKAWLLLVSIKCRDPQGSYTTLCLNTLLNYGSL